MQLLHVNVKEIPVFHYLSCKCEGCEVSSPVMCLMMSRVDGYQHGSLEHKVDLNTPPH